MTEISAVPAYNPVLATLVLPAQASFVSADLGCAFSPSAGTVTCTIANLNGASNVNRQASPPHACSHCLSRNGGW